MCARDVRRQKVDLFNLEFPPDRGGRNRASADRSLELNRQVRGRGADASRISVDGAQVRCQVRFDEAAGRTIGDYFSAVLCSWKRWWQVGVHKAKQGKARDKRERKSMS